MPNDYRPNMRMPQTLQAMGGTDPSQPSWRRAQAWPTLPRQSTNPNTMSIVRFYSTGLLPADTDNVLGTEATRNIRVDLPCILLWAVGSCITSDGSGLPQGFSPNDCYAVSFSTAGGEKITVESRLASTVVGKHAGQPGFFGGGGWVIQAGSTLVVGMTPRLAGLASGVNTRIDITVGVLEFRCGSSYIADSNNMQVA